MKSDVGTFRPSKDKVGLGGEKQGARKREGEGEGMKGGGEKSIEGVDPLEVGPKGVRAGTKDQGCGTNERDRGKGGEIPRSPGNVGRKEKIGKGSKGKSEGGGNWSPEGEKTRKPMERSVKRLSHRGSHASYFTKDRNQAEKKGNRGNGKT